MIRPSSALWLLPVALVSAAFSASTDMPRPDVCGIWPELAPGSESAQEIERSLSERTPPWQQRWEHMMKRRDDTLGRDPAVALREAREYDRTMPEASGAVESSANQTVPGNAWRGLGPESISGTRMDVSGRVRGLVVIDDNLLYIGAAGGGVWKWERDPIEQTETWTPLSDFEDSLAIGALAVDPQDPKILWAGTGEVGNGGSSYFGAGLLRTTDGGKTWTMTGTTQFTGQRFSTIVPDPRTVSSPATQRVLWAAVTNGLYRSTDGGSTWTRIRPGDFSDVVLDPYDPDIVFAAQHAVGLWKIDMGGSGVPQAISDVGGQLPTQRFGRVRLQAVKDSMGAFTYLYASMQDSYYGSDLKGIWMSPDHGVNWTRITGHPRQFADGLWANPNMLESESNDTTGTADTVPVNFTVQGNISTGSDVDVFRFTLAGRDSFNAEIMAERAGSALHPRLSLLDSAGNPVIRDSNPYVKNGALKNTAGVATHDSRMGTGWNLMPAGTYYLKVESDDGTSGQYQLSILGIDLWCQCGYDQALTVDPSNPNVIYMGLISFFRSTDGGTNWTEIQEHSSGNWIHQDIQVVTPHPSAANTIYVGSDGGLWRSADRGDTWVSMNTDGLRITQPVKAAIHPTDAGFIIVGNQDNASSKLESGVWTQLGDGDGMSTAIVSSTEYYYSSQNGGITKVDPVRGIDANMHDNGYRAAGAAFHTPFVMDPNNGQILIAGGGETSSTFRVYRTTDGAQNWNAVGSALSRHVMALAFAPSNSSIFYVATNTGTGSVRPEIWRVTGNGSTWTEITWPNMLNLPISDIEVSPSNSNSVYVTASWFGGGKVFRTTDAHLGASATWQDISRAPHGNATQPPGISTTPLPDAPVEAIVIDPTYPDTLWVGTDLGVYRTIDGGVNWHKAGQGLPNAGIRDMVLSTTAGGTGRLLAATHGRGVWELYVGNDDCSDATTIVDGTIAGTTRGATADGASTCSGDSGAPSVWYEYVATCDGQLRADTCGSNFDTLVSIHSIGCPGDQGNEQVCNDDCIGGCGNGTSCAVAQVTQGNTYNIRVTGYNGASGDFLLAVSCEFPNETCDTATSIAPGQTVTGSTRGAAYDAAPTCAGYDQTGPGVWYTLQGTGNLITLSTCGNTDFDNKLSVYCSGCVTNQCVAANDDACGTKSEVTFCSAPGTTYDVLVHGYQQYEGSFELQVTDGAYCGPVYLACNPSNDECDYAQELGNFTTPGDNTDATTGAAPTCSSIFGDVWYDYQPLCNGFATLGTCGSSGTLTDTVVAVYDECGGEEIGCNDDACGTLSELVLPMRPDDAMRVQVADYGGNGGDSGTFDIDVDTSVTLVTTPWPGLYVADGALSLEDHLLRIDRDSSSAYAVGPLGKTGVSGLAWASGLGLLYGVNDSIDVDETVVIDPDTGAATTVGPSGYAQLRGLAWDPHSMRLYSVDIVSDSLVRIDPFTGAGSTVGALGFAEVEALAFDPVADKLYGASVWTDQLIEIDTTTGWGTAVMSLGSYGEIRGLAFDAVRGELIGVQADGNDGRVVGIDPGTSTIVEILPQIPSIGPDAATWIEGLPDATVGQPYDSSVPVSGGCPRYLFSGLTGVPSGLSADGSGKLTGVATTSGSYTLGYDVDDVNLSTPYVSETFPLIVRPANDRCENAQWITPGTWPYSNVAAATDGPDEASACNFFAYTQVGADIWYKLEADCTGNLVLDTCGSGYDTKVAIYDSPGCPTMPSAVACNDDATCGAGSELSVPVVAGGIYTLRVGGYFGAQGPGLLNVSCVGVPAGGCCTGSNCSVMTEADCIAASGTYLGDGTDCTSDADGDGWMDGCDLCPFDPTKAEPGICGCGNTDFDMDGDGVPDCVDPDIDGDGVVDLEDWDPFDRHRCIDADGDGCDDCTSGVFDPANDGPDVDLDGWCATLDCDDTAPGAQRLPTEPVDLRIDGTGLITWSPPNDPGGPDVWYDTLTAPDAFDFVNAACLESDDADLTCPSGADPPPGVTWYYLVRSGNACGESSLGTDHPGATPRPGRTCP